MTTKPRGSRGTTVKQGAIDDAQSALQALPEKPKEKLSLKEAVERLKAPLQAALAKGYSYQELAVMLKENDIIISAATLKNYVPVGKRAAKNQAPVTKPRRGGKKADQSDDAIEEQLTQAASELSTPAKPNEMAAEPAPPRRGRTSSKAEPTAKAKGRGKAAATDEDTSETPKPTTRRRSSAAKTSSSTQRTTKRMSNR